MGAPHRPTGGPSHGIRRRLREGPEAAAGPPLGNTPTPRRRLWTSMSKTWATMRGVPRWGRGGPAGRSTGLPGPPDQATGATFSVQKLQRVAALGMVLRHSGQSRVVTSAGLDRRAARAFIGATTTK